MKEITEDFYFEDGLHGYSNKYQLGLYADYKGFACAVIGIDRNKIMGLKELIYLDKISVINLHNILQEIKARYGFNLQVINVNSPPYLQKTLKNNSLDFNVIELDINDVIFKITATVNDRILQINPDLWDDFLEYTGNFDPDIPCHQVNAIALAMEEIGKITYWTKEANEAFMSLFYL